MTILCLKSEMLAAQYLARFLRDLWYNRFMFKPKYRITAKILNNLVKIAEVKGMVEKSSLLPAREAFLRKTAVIKMAHTSTSIEGNVLNEYQVEQVAEGKEVRAEADQVKEIKNYLSALKKIDKLAEQKSHFNKADVLDVHKIVVSGLVEQKKAGHFRQTSVYIVNIEPDGKEEIAYTPPSASQSPLLVEELIAWFKSSKDVHPVIRAGFFHYQFVTIHPFTDGNGRVARLLTLLHLYQSGWDFRKALVVEGYYNADRKKYYERLQTGETYKKREEVDLTDWLEYFVEGFQFEVEKLREQVLMLSSLEKDKKIQQVLDKDELTIIDFITTVNVAISLDVADILKVPKRTAQEKLRRLVEKGILKRQGKGPSTKYVIASS